MDKLIIQITAGRGPVECGRVVAKVQEKILARARRLGVEAEVLHSHQAGLRGALLSTTILVQASRTKDSGSPDLPAFIKEWRGTIGVLLCTEKK